MPKITYLTTPLYYVNAAPHIGHSYTEVAADCLARYARLRGDDVFFLTGTDEHGEKIAQAAAAKGLSPKAFVDQAADTFTSLWQALGIAGSYDRFIRTTDPDHERIVQAVLQHLYDHKQLELGTQTFWYCVPCETSFGMSEIDAITPVCQNCRRPVSSVEEQDYYLNLEAHRAWLKGYIQSHDRFILPAERRNEVLAMLEHPLPNLCITRPKSRVAWGIEVPFDTRYVTYVWFDALLNYISALGWPGDEKFRRYWGDSGGAMHLIGKDIIRHHALYWPIILRALGVEPPKTIFAHGWWKIGEQKMSKSLGNIVDPTVIVGQLLTGQPYAADVYRYFLLREVPFGQDGSFSEDAIVKRLDSDLANDLGNLVNRTLSMVERYSQGNIPPPPAVGCAVEDAPLRQAVVALPQAVEAAMARIEFSAALEAVMRVVSHANQYIEQTAPWKLAKQPDMAPRLGAVLHGLGEVIRVVAILLEPFMPSVAQAMWEQLGCGTRPRRLEDAGTWPGLPVGQAIGPHPVLFPKATP